MDSTKIISLIQSITDLSSIFLLETLSKEAGFFANYGKVLYMAKDTNNYPSEEIETEFLKLQTHIRINAVKNNQTFADGYYNLITYKDTIKEDSDFLSFLKLCSIHSKNPEELSFRDFFYSLITIFQLPADQDRKNIIGLYGELKLMKVVYEHVNIDISGSWHKKGSYSKCDFSSNEQSMEVKATLLDKSEVAIKHQQIFGDFPCCLVVVICEEKEEGETVEEIIESMMTNSSAFNGLNFSINISKELKRVSKNDLHNLRFEFKDVLFFNTHEINPFPVFPENVSKMSYMLDYSDLPSMDKKDIDSILKKFE